MSLPEGPLEVSDNFLNLLMTSALLRKLLALSMGFPCYSQFPSTFIFIFPVAFACLSYFSFDNLFISLSIKQVLIISPVMFEYDFL